MAKRYGNKSKEYKQLLKEFEKLEKAQSATTEEQTEEATTE